MKKGIILLVFGVIFPSSLAAQHPENVKVEASVRTVKLKDSPVKDRFVFENNNYLFTFNSYKDFIIKKFNRSTLDFIDSYTLEHKVKHNGIKFELDSFMISHNNYFDFYGVNYGKKHLNIVINRISMKGESVSVFNVLSLPAKNKGDYEFRYFFSNEKYHMFYIATELKSKEDLNLHLICFNHDFDDKTRYTRIDIVKP